MAVVEPLMIIYIVGSLAIFVGGSIAGWIASRKDVKINKETVKWSVALIVTLVWVVAIMAEIFIPAYTVSLLIHGLMGGIVGYLFSDDGFTINFMGREK